MDLDDLRSNLHALKHLYGLLRKDRDGLPNPTSNMLDDKSRLLLKYLLDRATENAFTVHSEVLGDQASLSLTECSVKAQQPGDAWMQLSATEISAARQSCGDGQNGLDFTRVENDSRFSEPRVQKLSVTQPTHSRFENRNKFCRVCQRRIVRHSMQESAARDDTRNEAKSTAFPQQQNNHSNSFICSEDKEIRRSSNRFPGSTRSTKDSRQKGTTYLDCISSGNGSTDSSSNRPADAAESGSVCELTEETTQENDCLYYLNKEASNVIKQIEKRILDLQRCSGNLASDGRSSAVSIPGVAQQDLSDKMNDFVPNVEATCAFVMENPIILTGNEGSKGEFSATRKNDLHQKMDNRQCEGTSPLHQLHSRTRRSPVEMERPKLNTGSPLKLFPRKKTITSPVSSQTIGRYTGLASGCMHIDIGDPYEEMKRQNQMIDHALVMSNEAKLESGDATSSYFLKRRHGHHCSCSWTEDNKTPKMVTASFTCPNQINEEYLQKNQVALGEKIMKPGARQTSMPRRISKDYGKKQCQSPLHHEVDQYPARRMVDQYPARRIFRHQYESDNTSLSSNSSNWKSQQTNMSSSRSEEYYPSCQIQQWKRVDSLGSSENGMCSLSGESRGHDHGVSSGENEDYSWSSSDRHYKSTSCTSDERKGNSLQRSPSSSRVSTTGDSDTGGYSPYNHSRLQHHGKPRYSSVGSTSTKKMRPTGVYVSSKRANPGKRIGRWNKLKDRLSVIFHHHHHHHHHHLYHQQHSDDDEDCNSENRNVHGKFPSKRTVRRSHSMRLEDYEEKAPEKIGKAAIHNGHHKMQHKPGNALIAGLFKHIHHPKESKPTTKHIKRLREGQQDGNKVSTNLNWLKLLQRHRKAKKLGIGYGKR